MNKKRWKPFCFIHNCRNECFLSCLRFCLLKLWEQASCTTLVPTLWTLMTLILMYTPLFLAFVLFVSVSTKIPNCWIHWGFCNLARLKKNHIIVIELYPLLRYMTLINCAFNVSHRWAVLRQCWGFGASWQCGYQHCCLKSKQTLV